MPAVLELAGSPEVVDRFLPIGDHLQRVLDTRHFEGAFDQEDVVEIILHQPDCERALLHICLCLRSFGLPTAMVQVSRITRFPENLHRSRAISSGTPAVPHPLTGIFPTLRGGVRRKD
jgi:hypothetical protein